MRNGVVDEAGAGPGGVCMCIRMAANQELHIPVGMGTRHRRERTAFRGSLEPLVAPAELGVGAKKPTPPGPNHDGAGEDVLNVYIHGTPIGEAVSRSAYGYPTLCNGVGELIHEYGSPNPRPRN